MVPNESIFRPKAGHGGTRDEGEIVFARADAQGGKSSGLLIFTMPFITKNHCCTNSKTYRYILRHTHTLLKRIINQKTDTEKFFQFHQTTDIVHPINLHE